MPKVKIWKWEYGELFTAEDNTIYGWYPTDATFPPEPERDLEAEQAEWKKVLAETEGQPDIPF